MILTIHILTIDQDDTSVSQKQESDGENTNNQNQFDLSNVTQILDEAPQNGSPQAIYLRSNYGDEDRVNDIVKELQSFKHFWSSVESKLMNMEEAIICYSKGQRTGDKGDTTERFITDLLK